MGKGLERLRPEERVKRQIGRLIKAAQLQSISSAGDSATKRENVFEKDIALTRKSPQWHDSESLKPKEVANQIVNEVDKWVEKYGVGSPEELELFLKRLDTAASISNDPKIQTLRKKIAAKFTENIN